MRRWMFLLVHWAASLLFIAMIASWIAVETWPAERLFVGGGWDVGRWYVFRRPSAAPQRWFQMSIRHGALHCEQRWPIAWDATPRKVDWKWKNIRIASGKHQTRGHSPWRSVVIRTPAWIPVALVGLMPITAALVVPFKRHRLRKSGRCERCYYRLVGLPDPAHGDVSTRLAFQSKNDLRCLGRRVVRTAIIGALLGLLLIVGLSVIWFYMPGSRVLESRFVEFIVFPLQPVTQTSLIALWSSTMAYYAALFLLCRLLFGLRLTPARRNDLTAESPQEGLTARCPECGLTV